VYLPMETLDAPAAESIRRIAEPAQQAPQLVMVVEDEEMLRDLSVTMLEAEGYRVIVAKDGQEALEVFELHRDEIGLVVCDLGLPKLSGRDVFLKMKKSRPGVRVIVASGYLEPRVRSEILQAGVLDTIQKPYDFRDMIGKIRAIIGPAVRSEQEPQLF
ncbi:MAG: response regulator, partial [Verrucomicrobiota bacterium]|nr:response regulator [Verrucomicrobiota bacterium]